MPWELYDPENVVFFGGSGASQTRYVYNFNGVDSYIDVGSVVYTGDYSRSIKFKMPTLSGNFVHLWGKDADFSSRFLISDDGSANIRFSDSDLVGVNLPAGTFVTDVTYNVTVSRAGSAVKVTVNGVDFDFTGVNTDSSTFNFIQRMSSTSYGIGMVWGYTDSLGNNYPINDRTFGPGAVIANTGTVLGGELVVNGGFDTDLSGWVVGSQWSWDSSGAARLTSDGSYNVLQQSGILQVGKTYLVEFDLLECDNLLTLVNSFDESKTIISTSTIGRHSAIFKPTQNGDGILFKRGSVNLTNALIDNVSVKEADGYATGINLLESGWQEINI